MRFDDERPGPPELGLAVPGRHNLFDARGAVAAAELMGADAGGLAAALADFPGMLRRLERKGVHRSGAVVYDDYAHHPTEVAASLSALRELEPEATDRGLPATPLLAHAGRWRAASGARSPRPTPWAFSTSTRRARNRWGSWPG